jgi:dephospho-CoA kinase
VLWVGLSGGIGSGKSTVATRLAELGAVVVDSDALAREVVAPGSPGLAECVRRFGPEILTADGSLDRPVLGRIVFGDEQARRDLERITHPRIAGRTRELLAAAPSAAVVVHDIPLLVELDRAADYALTLVVDVPADVRLRRLVDLRGMDTEEARRRIASQADDQQRHAAADVLLPNTGTVEELHHQVDGVWSARLVPFEENLRTGRWTTAATVTEHEPPSPTTVARVASRVRGALGDLATSVEPVEGASTPPAEVHLEVRTAGPAATAGVRSAPGAPPDGAGGEGRATGREGEACERLARVGFVVVPERSGGSTTGWLIAGADPARVVLARVRH